MITISGRLIRTNAAHDLHPHPPREQDGRKENNEGTLPVAVGSTGHKKWRLVIHEMKGKKVMLQPHIIQGLLVCMPEMQPKIAPCKH